MASGTLSRGRTKVKDSDRSILRSNQLQFLRDQSTNALIGTAVFRLTLTVVTHIIYADHRANITQHLQSYRPPHLTRSTTYIPIPPPTIRLRKAELSKQTILADRGRLHLFHKSHEQLHPIELRPRHRRPSPPQTTTRHFHRRLPRPLHRPPRSHRNPMVSRQRGYVLRTSQ